MEMYLSERDGCFAGEGLSSGLRSWNVLCSTELPVQISHRI